MTKPAKTPFYDNCDFLHVGSLAGLLRSSRPQLRLDGRNGLHKFIWISKGSGRGMIDGVTRGFGPNTVLFIPQSVPHHISLTSNAHGTLIALEPRADLIVPPDTLFMPILNIMEQSQTSTKFDSIVGEYNSAEPGKGAALACYIGLLTVYVARLAQKIAKQPKSTASLRLMKGFSRALEQNFRISKTLADYARDLGVTPTHLTRVCQAANGKAASVMIQERVLNEARLLLLNTDAKILQISQHLGFTSAAYFTRLFSAKMGQTPREFRKSGNKGPQEMARRRHSGF
jgi:AraC family transcriptional regulator, transcriptional activator of pobA